MSIAKTPAFNDLDNPLRFLTSHGFESRTPTYTKTFGADKYFYGQQGEWFVTTPPAQVTKASVNVFKRDQHELHLQCPQGWADQMTRRLKQAVKMAHADMQQSHVDFETVWAHTTKPDFTNLQIRSKYKAKRTKVCDYVNMYNGENEITGRVDLCTGSQVQCSIRFILSEQRDQSEDCMHTSVRCEFGAGIRVLKIAGLPEPVKRPWDWKDVNFESLAAPMYDCVRVKTNAMTVAEVNGRVAKVVAKTDFQQAIHEFHTRAKADTWDNTITMPKTIQAKSVAVATVVPTRNKRHIHWTATSVSAFRPKRQKLKEGDSTQETAPEQPEEPEEEAEPVQNAQVTAAAKTDADNTDSSSDTQTTD